MSLISWGCNAIHTGRVAQSQQMEEHAFQQRACTLTMMDIKSVEGVGRGSTSAVTTLCCVRCLRRAPYLQAAQPA